jgi:hypothetical protein
VNASILDLLGATEALRYHVESIVEVPQRTGFDALFDDDHFNQAITQRPLQQAQCLELVRLQCVLLTLDLDDAPRNP